jgi:hypothetical protein
VLWLFAQLDHRVIQAVCALLFAVHFGTRCLLLHLNKFLLFGRISVELVLDLRQNLHNFLALHFVHLGQAKLTCFLF